MNIMPNPLWVRELHSDLAWKYKAHASKIETIWRSFNKDQRAKCLKAGVPDGAVRKNSLDTTLENEHKFVPELNLQDISTEPEFLLSYLKYHATESLFQQYWTGALGKPSDRRFILKMIKKENLPHVDPFKNNYTFFLDERYGNSFKIDEDEMLAPFKPAIRAGLCVPMSTAIPILQRQLMIFHTLNALIVNILDQGSETRSNKEGPKKSRQTVSAAFLKFQEQPTKLSLPDLVSSAQEQKDILEEFLSLLSAEPAVLAHAVKSWFFSRPGCVIDDKDPYTPDLTDKYISGAFFEAVHNTIKGTTIWNYICRLLDLLEYSTTDKIYQSIILQEISNICHLEYSRAQTQFTRHVQTGIGAKYFRKIANSYDSAGNPKTSLKIQPEELAETDPHLHYILRLCQSQTDANNAVEWIKKSIDFIKSHYFDARKGFLERELDAFGDLIVITAFIQDLSLAISMPAVSCKKAQMFVSWSRKLDTKLNKLRSEIDLRDFAVPIGNLLEPGMANGALTKLGQFVVSKMGSKMGLLYQDLVEKCFTNLEIQYQAAKEKLEKTEYIPLPTTDPQSANEIVEQKKIKEKTRPSQPTMFEIIQTPELPEEEDPIYQVFSTLFNKSEARGSISWAAFEGAMAELGFSVTPKYGSAYTFSPPDSMNEKKSFTVHRPHKSHIEGYLIPIFARRLRRTYGWNESTFKSG
ncbi:hypothetical protein GGI43DRAFT_431063 [Trichoderma evansii]